MLLNFEKAYKGIEEEKIIETPIKDIDYRTYSKAKSDLDAKKSGNATKQQILRYDFEWETWNFS